MKAALGYAELHALWKTGREAFDQGQDIDDAAYLIWMMQVRIHLTQEELAVFDQSPKDNSTDEFRDEKAAVLLTILRNRHGLNDGLKSAS